MTSVQVCAIWRSPDNPLQFTFDEAGVIHGPDHYRVKVFKAPKPGEKEEWTGEYKIESTETIKTKLTGDRK